MTFQEESMRYKWHWVAIAWLTCVCIIQLTSYWTGVVAMFFVILVVEPIVEQDFLKKQEAASTDVR